MKDLGSVDVPVRSPAGHLHEITWRNAKVAMPILATRLLAEDNGELRCQVDGGQIVNDKKKQVTQFISASGVYFQKMLIDRKFTALLRMTSIRLRAQVLAGRALTDLHGIA